MAGDHLIRAAGPAPDELGSAARSVVEDYLRAMAGRLDAPTSVLTDIRDELADGLVEAIESYRLRGLSPVEAAHAAVAEFGDPATAAAAFATELRLVRARRTGLELAVTGPVVGLLWIVTLLASGLWPGQHQLSGPWVVLPLVGLAVAVGAPAAEIAVGASGRLTRRLATRPGLAPAAATVACVAALVSDVTVLAAVAVHVLVLHGRMAALPALLAVAASLLRVGFVGPDLSRILFGAPVR